VSKRAHTPASAAVRIEFAIRMLEGRWKLLILFHLFGGKTLRFSHLERAIPGVSQKMLTQQLRQLEQDRVVRRIVHPEVPPKIEYQRPPTTHFTLSAGASASNSSSTSFEIAQFRFSFLYENSFPKFARMCRTARF
jgi:DNA-binding HxlR family transcriptional regulator